MILNYLAFALPLFLSFMAIEYFVAKAQKKDYFKFGNSIANLNTGIAERLCDTFTIGLFYFWFDYLHSHYAFFDIKPSILVWALLFISTDFLWYWYHRLAHEVNILWSVHIVHHQSEDFNYTAGVRITIFQAIVRTAFWSVLPLIGFPAEMIGTVLLIHGIYPFFIHTQTIGKLGVLEYILVTPSHHRVHHASNPRYLDKNYGDILIIWDKIFGTFAKEDKEDKPIYGLTKPLESYSFLWQHFHFLVELIESARHQKGFLEKIRLLFGKPDLVSPEIRNRLENKFLSQKRRFPVSNRFKNYVKWQIGSTLIILFFGILYEHYIPSVFQYLTGAVILITLINCGAILEQKTWIFYLEYARLALISLLFCCIDPDLNILLGIGIGLGLLSNFFHKMEEYYLRFLYGDPEETLQNIQN